MTLVDISGREYQVDTIFAKVDGKDIHLTGDALDLLFGIKPHIVDKQTQNLQPKNPLYNGDQHA